MQDTRSASRRTAPLVSSPGSNSLLGFLASDAFLYVDPQPAALKRGQVLQRAGDSPSVVYFPTTSVISLVPSLVPGGSVEVASVGREGMTNAPDVCINSASSANYAVEIPGGAYAMPARAFRKAMASNAAFHRAVHTYTNSLCALMVQSAACYRHHSVRQQCARWLLVNSTRLHSDDLPITHDRLAEILGVFRPTVSVAMSELQERQAIKAMRGHIYVLNRQRLAECACECMGAYGLLLGED